MGPKGIDYEMTTLSEQTLLSRKLTVGDYLIFEARHDKEAIAKFILSRFTERYITPIESAQ